MRAKNSHFCLLSSFFGHFLPSSEGNLVTILNFLLNARPQSRSHALQGDHAVTMQSTIGSSSRNLGKSFHCLKKEIVKF